MKWFFIVIFVLIVGATSVQASPVEQQTVRRLDTGTVVMQDATWKWGSDNKLIVTNGQNSDAVLTLLQDSKSMIAVYVRAGDNYTLDNIWHSTFSLSWVLGEDWDGSAGTFTRNVQRDLFNQPLVFDRTVIVGQGDAPPSAIQYSYWKAYLGSPRSNDPKTLEELGGSRLFPRFLDCLHPDEDHPCPDDDN